MPKALVGQESLHLKEVSIPIFVHIESRSYVRASFASKGINLRIPIQFKNGQIRDQISWCKEWARKKIIKKPSLAYRYINKIYTHGTNISLYDGNKSINLIPTTTSKNKAYINNDKINIQFNEAQGTPNSDSIIKIVVKLLNREYLHNLTNRLEFINNLTLKADYKSCTIKYLKTQWGNCAFDGKVKLSTRILFLPEKIQNAIILHELVHLLHFNHGDLFYDTLIGHMPDYNKRMAWLKKNENILDF